MYWLEVLTRGRWGLSAQTYLSSLFPFCVSCLCPRYRFQARSCGSPLTFIEMKLPGQPLLGMTSVPAQQSFTFLYLAYNFKVEEAQSKKRKSLGTTPRDIAQRVRMVCIEPLEISDTLGRIDWNSVVARPGGGTRRPVFVVGSPRSGTTMLAACLGHAPGCVVRRESLFLLDCWSIFANLHQGANRRLRSALQEYIDSDELITSIGLFADKVLFGKTSGRFIDHTPWYGVILPLLVRLYPDAQFVHVIRNGRFVSRSLLKSYKSGFAWAGSSLRETTVLWRELVSSTLENARSHLKPENYLEVRYEDICAAPNEKLEEIFAFLALGSPTSASLQQLALPHATPSRRDALLARVVDGGVEFTSPRDGFLPERWSIRNEQIFTEVAGNLAQALGYASNGVAP
jgi:hypothetical protein